MRLRVATYNIRKCIGLDWRRRPDRVLSVINELQADIIALQEADRRFGAKLATLAHATLVDAGWQAASVAAHEGGLGWHGNAVLLAPSFELDSASRLTLPRLEPRGAVIVDVRRDGVALRIVGTHLGLTAGKRAAQAVAIAEALADRPPRPTIMMGDMNEWRPQGGCIAIFMQTMVFAAPAPTFHATRPVAALDRIAASPDIAILRHGVHASEAARRASDHLPLWADIALRSAE